MNSPHAPHATVIVVRRFDPEEADPIVAVFGPFKDIDELCRVRKSMGRLADPHYWDYASYMGAASLPLRFQIPRTAK